MLKGVHDLGRKGKAGKNDEYSEQGEYPAAWPLRVPDQRLAEQGGFAARDATQYPEDNGMYDERDDDGAGEGRGRDQKIVPVLQEVINHSFPV